MPVKTQIAGDYQIKDFSIPEIKLSVDLQDKLNALTGLNIIATANEDIEAGSLVYVSSAGGVSKGDFSDPLKARIIGVTLADASLGSPVTVCLRGAHDVRLVLGLTLEEGDYIFLSTDGRGTNVPPSAPAYHTMAGIVLDASGYDPSGGNPVAVLATLVQEPIRVL